MKWISFYMFGLAAVIHLVFFLVETFFFQTKSVQAIFRTPAEAMPQVKIWAWNQGFYNLFLAIGMFAGLSLVLQLKPHLAGLLVGYCGLCMVAAGFVLLWSYPQAWKGALLQILPPLIGFLFLAFHIAMPG